MDTSIDCLIEKTETHILVGLFLLYLPCQWAVYYYEYGITYPQPSPQPSPQQRHHQRRQLHQQLGQHRHHQMGRMPTWRNPQRSTNFHVSYQHICKLSFDSANLVDVLSVKLLDEGIETLLVDLNSDGLENGGDVLSGRGGLSTDGEEEVCCEILHFECYAQILSVK